MADKRKTPGPRRPGFDPELTSTRDEAQRADASAMVLQKILRLRNRKAIMTYLAANPPVVDTVAALLYLGRLSRAQRKATFMTLLAAEWRSANGKINVIARRLGISEKHARVLTAQAGLRKRRT